MTLTISARQPAQNGSSPASQRGRVASNPRILALHYYIGRVGETRGRQRSIDARGREGWQDADR